MCWTPTPVGCCGGGSRRRTVSCFAVGWGSSPVGRRTWRWRGVPGGGSGGRGGGVGPGGGRGRGGGGGDHRPPRRGRVGAGGEPPGFPPRSGGRRGTAPRGRHRPVALGGGVVRPGGPPPIPLLPHRGAPH